MKQAQERAERSALAFTACASGFWFLILQSVGICQWNFVDDRDDDLAT